jgi:hypothetical protein
VSRQSKSQTAISALLKSRTVKSANVLNTANRSPVFRRLGFSFRGAFSWFPEVGRLPPFDESIGGSTEQPGKVGGLVFLVVIRRTPETRASL